MVLIAVFLLVKLEAKAGSNGRIDEEVVIRFFAHGAFGVVEDGVVLPLGVRAIIDESIDEGDVISIFFEGVGSEVIAEGLDHLGFEGRIISGGLRGIGVGLALHPKEAADDRLLAGVLNEL